MKNLTLNLKLVLFLLGWGFLSLTACRHTPEEDSQTSQSAQASSNSDNKVNSNKTAANQPSVKKQTTTPGRKTSKGSNYFNFNKGSAASKLADLAGQKNPDPNKMLIFTSIKFEEGGSKLDPSSQQSLLNIASIMAAYPKLKLNIYGLSDKGGDAQISKNRAETTKEFLVKSKINQRRIKAQASKTRPMGRHFIEISVINPKWEE